MARSKLRKFEEELHAAHEAGMTSYSGMKAWTFINGMIYCMTVITTIGKLLLGVSSSFEHSKGSVLINIEDFQNHLKASGIHFSRINQKVQKETFNILSILVDILIDSLLKIKHKFLEYCRFS